MKPNHGSGALRAACLVTVLCGVMVFVACATTKPTRSAKPAGFLGDYAQLKKGEKDEAQLIYIKEGVDWAGYNAVIIDPVTIWVTDKAKMRKMKPKERQQLADYLYASLKKELEKDYVITQRPGPNVLRIRAAITEAKGSKVVLDTVSSVIPQMRLISGAKKLITGTHSFVGKAAAEAEVIDSMTGWRLMAGVDERAGGKTFKGVTSKWSDVKSSYDYWAQRFRKRLADLSGREIKSD